MAGVPGAVLTIDELSAYLRIPKSTLYRLSQSGEIPCKKVGRQWRFHRASIDGWLAAGRGSRSSAYGKSRPRANMRQARVDRKRAPC